ncbi:hypothetical protein ALC62_05988 [Cyphomyrmex costatus]|uniref:Uncharacterized protein n=1 Tax=Cyphomyrmex costatus TaxID=456900 RepID=A0A195CQY8_9HYME|nr:hypothetical protein ALC62_05988 [Cyphomyrmex costatus]
METRDKSTEWALLFPLKAGLFAMKSSLSSKSVSRGEKESKERLSKKNLREPRAKIRRGSSLSDLDKLQNKAILPDVVKSTEQCSESLPHSPALSRTNLQLGSSSVRGSIGDLMNMKKYGGSTWSVRSETLIAKAVPLSTVTMKQNSPNSIEKSMEDDLEDELQDEFPISGKALTCAQRTQRLSRLIKKQRRIMVFSPSVLQRDVPQLFVLLLVIEEFIDNLELPLRELPRIEKFFSNLSVATRNLEKNKGKGETLQRAFSEESSCVEVQCQGKVNLENVIDPLI